MARTEFFLLGPLMIRSGKAVIPVPHGKQRALLAVLLLNANMTVSLEEIMETLWGPAPPPSARTAVQNNVMRLRRTLTDTGNSRISTRPRGYVIHVDAEDLDLARFQALLASAREMARDGSWNEASTRARAALSLWRGEPLENVESGVLATREIPRLTELRLQAVETSIDAELHLGQHSEVILELERLIYAHPFREHLHSLLMLSLYRSGRQTEALAAYRRARKLLVDEIGTEPGGELRRLYQRILKADPGLDTTEPASDGECQARLTVPRELPPGIHHFIGRLDELATLTELLDKAHGGAPVVISAIGGTAGVGKTALAVCWAHRVAERFPDGQLYVNLRGYGPHQPLAAADALARFLRALGVPGQDIPSEEDERAARYRSVLAGKRVLIVLDNAHDAAQVRPLLPGAPGCLAMVTSRSQLTSLVAAEGAVPLVLDVLTQDEARALLAWRLGAVRIAGEPAAAEELIALCARLPLALCIAAARSVGRPGFPLSALAAELRESLDALDGGDAAANIRAAFSWSYRSLSTGAARMFRLLGTHPGPDISAPAAASLAGIAASQAREALRELVRSHLLSESTPGRFAFHDLLRVYAAGQARALDGAPDLRSATHRVLDHYLHTGSAAALLLNPARRPLVLNPPQAGTAPESLASDRQALTWFAAEHEVLLTAVTYAAGAGFDSHVWQIVWTLGDFLDWRCYWQEWAAIQRTALASACLLDDQDGQARTHLNLGRTYSLLGSYREAQTHLQQCVQLAWQFGDRNREGRGLVGLARLFEQQGHYPPACEHAEQALSIFLDLGHHGGQADALMTAGWCHTHLGNSRQAIAYGEQAMALHREVGDRRREGITWVSLGYAHHNLGHHEIALTCYQQAIDLLSQLGDRYNQAQALAHLAESHLATGDPTAANDAWQEALAILDDLCHPEADHLRAKLRDLVT